MPGRQAQTILDPLDQIVVENRRSFEFEHGVKIDWEGTECIRNKPKAGLPLPGGSVVYHCRQCGAVSGILWPKRGAGYVPKFYCLKCVRKHEEMRFGAKILNWDDLPIRVRGGDVYQIVPSRPGAEVVIKYGCPVCGVECKIANARTGREVGTLLCDGCLRDSFEKKFGAKVLNWGKVAKTEKRSANNPRTIKSKSLIKFVCTSCGKNTEKTWYAEGDGGVGPAKPICPECQKEEIAKIHPKSTSTGEDEVAQFIQSLGFDIQRNLHRIAPPHELDIVIPSSLVAVEYDGLYHHSEEAGKDWNYHLNKTLACSSIGYRLIHIFEDEWKTKEKIVRSRLANILKVGALTKVNARDCEVVEMEHEQHTAFMNENHLQGARPASEAYGLKINGRIVACMTFSRPRMAIGNINGWELLRFACSHFTTVRGGASRLLSVFRKKYPNDTIVSFADRRWSDGGLYDSLGFKFQHNSRPGYWYVDHLKRFHRSTFTKHSLVSQGFDSSKSEKQIMRELGYRRIWDCGTLVYRLDPTACPPSPAH